MERPFGKTTKQRLDERKTKLRVFPGIRRPFQNTKVWVSHNHDVGKLGHIFTIFLRNNFRIFGLGKNYRPNKADMEAIPIAGSMHDAGKETAKISRNINKPRKLTRTEFELMKKHVIEGVKRIARQMSKNMSIEELKKARKIIQAVMTHHERFDGKGYPRNLSGKQIPLSGRILAICDVFCALTEQRGYKESKNLEKALSIINSDAGKAFDPELVKVFTTLMLFGGGLERFREQRTGKYSQ